jgi:hypothetical protein
MVEQYSADADSFHHAAVEAVKYMHQGNMSREGLQNILHTYALVMEEIASYNGVFSARLDRWNEVIRRLRHENELDLILGEE